MIVDVHEKRLDSRTAAGVAPLLNTLLRALGSAELEQRICDLERQIEKLQGTASEGAGRQQCNDEDGMYASSNCRSTSLAAPLNPGDLAVKHSFESYKRCLRGRTVPGL